MQEKLVHAVRAEKENEMRERMCVMRVPRSGEHRAWGVGRCEGAGVGRQIRREKGGAMILISQSEQERADQEMTRVPFRK